MFKQFKLDEPWDSPHNIKLLEKMPTFYQAPGHKKELLPPNHTVCHVFVGKGTAFERSGMKLRDDFPDGASNTLMFVEAGEPVPWTKPADIGYDPAKPLPELKGLFKDGFRACMADGTRRHVRYDTPGDVLKAAITRNGGERLSLP